MIRLWGLKSRDPGPPNPRSPGGPSSCPQHPPALRFVSVKGLLPLTAVAASRGGATSASPPAPSDSVQESPASWLVPKTPPPLGLAFVSWEWMGWVWLSAQGYSPAVRTRVGSWGRGCGRTKGSQMYGITPTAEFLKITPPSLSLSGFRSSIVP